ncbi:rhamnogalacturonan acetylesterase [Brevundimonas intermedia]|uniref:Rhamnogalacturonan acetylesterase n=1 Tax=Brevundimonas intermedia TaxID=74315 RepID=A0ABQ5TAE2_9CAUL|nr:rhamnogalacturonan acetylesterase [Brevundimonas intermedia]
MTRQQVYASGQYGYEPGASDDGFLFSVAVPEGVYRVTIRFGGTQPGRTTVKAEARRLMARDVVTPSNTAVTRSFLVHVRSPALPPPPANAPGRSAVSLSDQEAHSLTWDNKLTLEFLGRPRVASIDIEPVETPVIYLAGDSTVTDQPAEPATSWGQMLPALLTPDIAVANYAHSGETLKSFISELRLAKILSTLKADDWLFIQFGHNDQKTQWPQTYADPQTTYPAYLRVFIAEARRRGAHPVLVTSPERRTFRDGRIVDSLGDYPEAVRRVAREEGVPLIDLNDSSRRIYEALGPDVSATLFNDGGADRTHHNNAGAWLLARALAAQVAQQIPELSNHVSPEARRFVPDAAMMQETDIVASGAYSQQRPSGD